MWPDIVVHGASILAALTMSSLCCYPIIAYMRRGWGIKRNDILSSFDDDAKTIYVKTFLRLDDKIDPKILVMTGDQIDHVATFDRLYIHRYGRYRLVVPAFFLMIVVFPISFLIVESALARLLTYDGDAIKSLTHGVFQPALIVLPDVAVGALAGAYTWIVYALIRDAAKYNLQPPSILTAVLRMIVAAPLGYAIGSLATKDLGPFLAFAVGAFPLDMVQVLLQRIANKKLDLDIGADQKADQVTMLNGVDSPTADRLELGDITTISQLAYCDPVQLAMRTNMTFDAVVDLVSQALAWIYLGAALNTMRPLGLRGALEIQNLSNRVSNQEIGAAEAFTAAASAANINIEGLRNAFGEISGDPYTDFLAKVWGR